jgi:[protein-PII] uridylyltransferase
MSSMVGEAAPPAGAGWLRDLRADLLARGSLGGRGFCEAYSDAIDVWIASLAQDVFAAARRGDRLTLLAVGGYGRRELCPGSDLDLVLLHDSVRDIERVADRLWYPMWDANLQVDHSVRTPRETLDVVGWDLKSALGLLTARVVAGDEDLGSRVIEDARRLWSLRARPSLGRLRAALEERWAQHGEVAFLLEPDLKLSRGGLRDVEALHAAALASPSVSSFAHDPRVAQAADAILDARVALHATTGRRSDQLLLGDQDAAAVRLGFVDGEQLLPHLAAAGRTVAWATEEVCRRIDAWLGGPHHSGPERVLEPGILLRREELALEASAKPDTDSGLALRLAAASARTGIPIAPGALDRLAAEAASPAEPWPRETLDALLDLLGCGRSAIPVLETLDHLGVLGRYLAEWETVRSKPQRNMYHRYTVDRHLFETAAEGADLTRSVHRPDLLLIACWLHDLGKGYPGDHSETGERAIQEIARRMGIGEEDAATLGRLVRHHLILSDTAMRRDLNDPAAVAAVAERVNTEEELDLLAALTRADSIATGPAAWSAWKADLIEELVARVRRVLSGEPHDDVPPAPTHDQRELIRGGRLRVQIEGSRVTVVAPDRPGLLGLVAGVLAVNGLGVRTATGLSEQGMAVDVFDVDLGGRDGPDPARLGADLALALEDPARLAARLAQRARSVRLPRRPGAARVAAPMVLLDNHATPRATIVEVRAPDGIGLLSRIASAIAVCGCDISLVRALTLGHEVVDTFYVTEDGAKLADPVVLETLERAILSAVTKT